MKHVISALLALATLTAGAGAQSLGRLEDLVRQRLEDRQSSSIRLGAQSDVSVTPTRTTGPKGLTPELIRCAGPRD